MIELTRASFQYENSDRGVRDISLSVKSGEGLSTGLRRPTIPEFSAGVCG